MKKFSLRSLAAMFLFIGLAAFAQGQTPEPQKDPPAPPIVLPDLPPLVLPDMPPLLLPDLFPPLPGLDGAKKDPHAALKGVLEQKKLRATFNAVHSLIERRYYDTSKLNNWSSWKEKLPSGDLTKEQVDKLIGEMVGSLGDHYTSYDAPMDLKKAMEIIGAGEHKKVATGAALKADKDGRYKVIYIARGSSAHSSRLKVGDEVLSVNGKKLAGLGAEVVSGMLRGVPDGKVKVTYKEGDKKRSINLTFQAFPEASLEMKRLKGNILYVYYPDFMDEDLFAEFLVRAFEMREKDGPFAGIALDLRGNMGGRVNDAMEFAAAFLEKGTALNITNRRGRIQTTEKIEFLPPPAEKLEGDDAKALAFMRNLQNAPMVVLVDGSTASSAEIVSGALAGNERAKLVGTKTFGKGVSMITFDLPNLGTLTVTSGRFWTPSGHDFSKGGLLPHITVLPSRRGPDAQLNGALRELEAMIKVAKVAR